MATSLDILTLDPVAGPDPAAMLAHVCAMGTGDVALLHSAAGERGSFSVLGFDPLLTLEVDAQGAAHLHSRLGRGAALPESMGLHPLELLEDLIEAVEFAPPHPLIGWLGFIGYDIGRTLEQIGAHAPDELHWPLLRWSLFKHYLLHDAARGGGGQWRGVTLGGEGGDPELLQQLLAGSAAQASPAAFASGVMPAAGGEVTRTMRPADFCANVERVKQYIAAGDIYQANLAQRWEIAPAAGDSPVEIYRRLCASSPAPYAGFMRFVSPDAIERHVLSASPELFLNVNGGRVVTRPIKGTRPRDMLDPVRDIALRDELLASDKDQAELAMIVDLLRNDLGRVAQYGTVRVEAPRDLEAHPTVWHTVATIAAILRRDAGLADLLRAVCPGGSITGAPKIRAMQIIEELEGFRRGMYCGNIGVIGPGGGGPAQSRSLTLSIAIRTIVMQAGRAHVYAGGGIVADSDPQMEYQETLDKAAAPLKALGIQAEPRNHPGT